MKKTVFLTIIVLVFAACVPALAADDITVNVDGITVEFDQAPIIVDGRTLVPVRAIFESLGARVKWDDLTKTVNATKRFETISLTIGSNEMKVSGKTEYIDVPAQIVGGRTLVPARAVAQALEAQVLWDDNKRLVTINSKQGKYYIEDHFTEYSGYHKNNNDILISKININFPQIFFDSKTLLNDKINNIVKQDVDEWTEDFTVLAQEKANEFSENGGVFDSSFKTMYFSTDFDIMYNNGNYVSVYVRKNYDLESEKTASYSAHTYDVVKNRGVYATEILDMEDIELRTRINNEFLKIGVKLGIDNINTENFYLTDEGVAFFVQVDEEVKTVLIKKEW